jgi:hypothetical protein
MSDKKDRLELTEVFIAKAGKHGWNKCFYGTIQRGLDADDNPIVRGKIKVKDGFICAQARDQWELGEKLDELVLLVLEYELQGNPKPDTNISLN